MGFLTTWIIPLPKKGNVTDSQCEVRLLLLTSCKTVGFFSKSVKKSAECGVRVLRARSARASHAHRAWWGVRKRKKRLSPVSLSVFSLVPDLLFDFRAYLNTLKYGLFCSLSWKILRENQIVSSEGATKEVSFERLLLEIPPQTKKLKP